MWYNYYLSSEVRFVGSVCFTGRGENCSPVLFFVTVVLFSSVTENPELSFSLCTLISFSRFQI